MTDREKARTLLLEQCKRYPELLPRDIFKFIYQSAYGCEHLAGSEEGALEYVKNEYATMRECARPLVERLCGGYSRVGLGNLALGLSPLTLARIFCLSAVREEDGDARLHAMLETLVEMENAGLLPFGKGELDTALAEWRAAGYPPVRHSERFRELYAPAYRVVSDKIVPFLPLLTELDKRLAKGRVILAVEGGSASGKTTLAALLEKIYDPTIFHADDFFLRPEQRTPERFAEPGGNLDRERLREEVLTPLSRGERVTYRPFLCSSFTLGEPITVEPKRLTVVEGAYSMHPELERFYDLSAFIEVSPELQRERIKKRNTPEHAERFFNEWIPLEKRYFDAMRVKERCNVRIMVT